MEFHVLDVSPSRGRPKLYCILQLSPLYASEWPMTKEEKHKDVMDLLLYIPPIHHEYFNRAQLQYICRVLIRVRDA